MTFYLKSRLFISSATSHPILRWSHHRSRYSNAPTSPMLIILIFVSSPTRARCCTFHRVHCPCIPFQEVSVGIHIATSAQIILKVLNVLSGYLVDVPCISISKNFIPESFISSQITHKNPKGFCMVV